MIKIYGAIVFLVYILQYDGQRYFMYEKYASIYDNGENVTIDVPNLYIPIKYIFGGQKLSVQRQIPGDSRIPLPAFPRYARWPLE